MLLLLITLEDNTQSESYSLLPSRVKIKRSKLFVNASTFCYVALLLVISIKIT